MMQVSARSGLETHLGGMMPVWAAFVAIPTAALALISLRWGIVHDAPLMYFIGRDLLTGVRSVGDVFDMNMPLVYWIHASLLAVFGLNEVVWRLLDLAVLGLICTFGYRLIQPIAPTFVWGAVLWIIARHLTGGPELVGQRDVVMVALVLGAGLLLLRIRNEEGDVRVFAAAGALLGTALMLKLTAVFYPPLLLAALLAIHPALRQPAKLLRACGWLMAGGAVPCLGVAIALYLQGALADLIEIRAFLLPLYGQERVPLWEMIRQLEGVLPAALIVAATALYGAGLPRAEPRIAILTAILVGSLLSYSTQGKGWPYHAAPLWYSLILLTAVFAEHAWQASRAMRLAIGFIVPLVALPLMMFVYIHASDEWAKAAEGPSTPAPLVATLIEDLDRLAPRNVPVQSFDQTHGVIDALLRSGRNQPTRFIYDFPFFIGEQSAYRDRVRKEFLTQLETAGPHLLVVTNQQWPLREQGFERVEDPRLWPELHRLLNAKYKLEVERSAGLPDGKQYRIFRAAP